MLKRALGLGEASSGHVRSTITGGLLRKSELADKQVDVSL